MSDASSEAIGELYLVAGTFLHASEFIEDGGLDDVSPDDSESRGSVFRLRFFDKVFDLSDIAFGALWGNDSVG